MRLRALKPGSAFSPPVLQRLSLKGIIPSGTHTMAANMGTGRRIPVMKMTDIEFDPKDFSVTGGPTIVTAGGEPQVAASIVQALLRASAAGDPEPLAAARRDLEQAIADQDKPVLLFLPGLDFTGLSLAKQIPTLTKDFEVRYLAASFEDRTGFSGLADVVKMAIENEYSTTGRRTYLVGESTGGVLALTVALKEAKPPAGLAGLALINPATSVTRSWPSQLQPLVDAISALPPGVSDATYAAIATPIFAYISSDPLQIFASFEDDALPEPLRAGVAAGRLARSLPELLKGVLGSTSSSMPLPTLAFRLAMLVQAAKKAEELKLSKLTLPVQVFASSEDKALPSVSEGRRLVRALPNAGLTVLQDSGHTPLLEVRVRFAELLRKSRLTERAPVDKKDYVNDFKMPSAEEFAQASERLSQVRKLTSPVFFSTDSDGRRVAGLSGLPSLPVAGDKSQTSVEGQSSEHTPPVLFVGNHQLYGFLDIPLIPEEIYKQTGVLVRALVHPVIFAGRRSDEFDFNNPETLVGETTGAGPVTNSPMAGGLVDYEKFGGVPAAPRTLFKLLSKGENTLLYPGGVREAFKSTKQGEMYKLFWPPASETSDFARLAARFGATIVPVAAIGGEDAYEMFLDADELLRIPYFGELAAENAKSMPVARPGERFVSPVTAPKVPGRFYFLFGRPIDTRGVDASDKEACAALYTEARNELEKSLKYLLEKRKEDPWEQMLPRVAFEASTNWARQAPTFTP